MKAAGLPLEFKVRFLNLIEWDLHRAFRRDLDVKRLVHEPGKLAFKASLTFDRVAESNPNFLADDALEIARAAKFALNSGRTHFESVSVPRNGIFLVKQAAEAFRDELTVAVGDTSGFVYINAQKTRLTCPTKLDFDDFDVRACGGPVT